jgi:para-nitrobenzyl esterase
MERTMKQRIWMMAMAIIILGFFLVYMGCSGGGGDGGGGTGGGGTDIVLLTGYFMDGPVEGLRYNTATQSGYTGVDGSFQYAEGETVRFYIGSVLIGQAMGTSEITPFDLAGIAPPQTNLEIVRTMNRVNKSRFGTPFETATNITIFLQSLDEDGDFSNGI